MFDRFIIIFFYFFLTSRFFSEKLRILPKWFDVANYFLFGIIILLLIINLNKKGPEDGGESNFISKIMLVFSIAFFISSIFNQFRILPPATALFYAGFMEGPFLFIALNKLSKNRLKLASNINKIFFILLIINLVIIVFLDLPEFLFTGNPDIISGTYGNNTYQFSMLLIICGGYLLGYNYSKKYKTVIVILSQLLILVVFYLTQFRAGLPFFMVSYFIMIGMLYGKKLIIKLIPIFIILIILLSLIISLNKSDEKIEGLKFDDWIELLAEPTKYLTLGKFKIYNNVLEMWNDNPQTFIIGTGPGNFMSRANYTFSYELMSRKESEGVPYVINMFFGIKYPYFSDIHKKYLLNSLKSESVFGTWQLSNPYSSYLAGITEIGVFGGIAIVLLYAYFIIASLKFFRIIQTKKSEYLPLAITLVGATIYIFGLAFLDNYWETARVTLPVWLLFWAVKTAVYEEPDLSQSSD